MITDFSLTEGGYIWVNVDEATFINLRDNEWRFVVLYPQKPSQVSMFYEVEDCTPHGWTKIIITCHMPGVIYQRWLGVLSSKVHYTGPKEKIFDEFDGEEKNVDAVEPGDEGWKDYYTFEFSTRLLHT